MSLAVTYPHISKTEGEAARLARSPRIRVAQIAMDYLAHGWSVEEICRQHPNLAPAEVHAAMLYYWDHQHEIDAEIRAEYARAVEDSECTAPSPSMFRPRGQEIR
jgi:uncharacterized protein (DUF433 family)